MTKYKHFTLRDKEIVQAVYEARYMTYDLIQFLFFAPTTLSSCKKRIQHVFTEGYLRRRDRMNVNEPYVYYLGLKGRRFVTRELRLDKEYVDAVAGVNGESYLFMRHDLTLSKIYTHFRKQVGKREYKWRNTRMLEEKKWAVQPDAAFEIYNGDKTFRAFVEFTNRMPSTEEMKRKCDGYATLPETPILWFTTSLNQLKRLRAFKHAVASQIYVGLIEEVAHFLTSPMWVDATGNRVQLMRAAPAQLSPQSSPPCATHPSHPSSTLRVPLVGRVSLEPLLLEVQAGE